jgi:hypothetical protein
MPETFISILSGKIIHPTAWAKFLWTVKDGTYIVKLERKNKRSVEQNRYIHGVLFPELAKAFTEAGWEGFDAEFAKEVAKAQFLKRNKVNEKTGEVQEYVAHTSKLSKMEMMEFIENVIRFAAVNLNYEIPFPNEQTRLNV